jgi:hypothetical protein
MYHRASTQIKKNMYQTAVKILKATIGIQTNAKELLPPIPFEVKLESLLTDFHRVEQIPPARGLDGTITVENNPSGPAYEWKKNKVIFRGPFSRLQKEASDPRYSLWGNQGFLYRYTLYLLEKKHKIYNLHACAMYKEDKDALYLIIGGAGSGKTVYLLSGLGRELSLFATETVHFQMARDEIHWYMGSVVDNVRYGTLAHDFPYFLPSGSAHEPRSQWQEKVAIDLSAFSANKKILRNPQNVHIVFPRIEKGFPKPAWTPVKNSRKAEKLLFDNITQKLSETTLLYDKLAVLGLDGKDLANLRLQAVRKLVGHQSIAGIRAVITNPQECWGDLLE